MIAMTATWHPILRAIAALFAVFRFAYLDPEAGKARESGRAGTESAFGRQRTANAEYNFATDGGAVGTINLHTDEIPAGAIITGSRIDVLTVPTSGGAATLAAGVETNVDIQAAVVITGAPWSTVGAKAGAGANTKTTAGRVIKATVGVAALTAGRFRVYVDYIDTRA